MKILIKNARILNELSKHHDQTKDILINDGVIEKIENGINDGEARIIEEEDIHVSLGWTDLKADLCDPGQEHKETIESGLKAAAYGGYTHISVLPSTNPVVDGKSQIEYMQRKADGSVTSLHPIGCVTKGKDGGNLAELYDMFNSGARFFSDDYTPMSGGILYCIELYYTLKILAV
jgi:dihydroorotase